MKNSEPCSRCFKRTMSPWSRAMNARRCDACGFIEEKTVSAKDAVIDANSQTPKALLRAKVED